MREENRAYLKELGISIYLKNSLPVLYQRILKRGVPAYLDQSDPFAHLEEIAQERIPIYESHCQYTIEAENVAENELVDKIVHIYGWK